MTGEHAIQQQLQSLVGTRKKARLTRSIPSEPSHNGFVLAVGEQWVLLACLHDFYPEGYAALRLGDIVDVRSGAYERQWERMLEGEGIVEGLLRPPPADVSLQSTASLLETLRRRGDNVIVECEDADEETEDFYIGRILSVDGETLRFANFDALGRWDEQPHAIPLADITQVQFETPYVRTFSRYLAGECPL